MCSPLLMEVVLLLVRSFVLFTRANNSVRPDGVNIVSPLRFFYLGV